MARHPYRDAFFTALLAAASFGGSCTSDNTGGYDPHSDDRPSYPDHDYSRDRDDDRPGRIPRQADVVREGTGKLKWTADLDGTFYVYDRDQDAICYYGPARRGDELEVKPDDDVVLVNDRAVFRQNLERHDTHQLYFLAARPDAGRPQAERAQAERPQAGRPDAGRHDAPVYGTEPVPKRSVRLARGSDGVEIRSIKNTGTVYVYDDDAQRILFTGTLKRGGSLRAVPKDGRIYANGESVAKVNFTRGHQVSIYFLAK